MPTMSFDYIPTPPSGSDSPVPKPGSPIIRICDIAIVNGQVHAWVNGELDDSLVRAIIGKVSGDLSIGHLKPLKKFRTGYRKMIEARSKPVASEEKEEAKDA